MKGVPFPFISSYSSPYLFLSSDDELRIFDPTFFSSSFYSSRDWCDGYYLVFFSSLSFLLLAVIEVIFIIFFPILRNLPVEYSFLLIFPLG
ncbi:hypothetical protein THIOM_000473 [Candidatus Thiomargarita nelsonii]|uniref:Uncharacterized protein n=1 Tax=Candidatus Thiomargarita nelsonii TaxID=1003181 RepID=A0A176S6U9_9GAMM|nr:hypothetical protein THIOM_000473 [Candidatus Thiomargarita nelsonii]